MSGKQTGRGSCPSFFFFVSILNPKNAGAYSLTLELLDKHYRKELASYRKDILIHAGILPLVIQRGDTTSAVFLPARGSSPNTEPTTVI